MEELSLSARDDFEKVLERYNKMVYRLAFSRTGNYHDANDILQDVFMRYIRADKTYNDEEHRKAWLITATINCSKSLVTSSWNKRRADLDPVETAQGGPDKELERSDRKNAVYNAVMELPAKYRTVVHLFYYEDLSVLKICEITGTSETAVKTQLHRARNMLKEKLEGVEFDV